MCLLQELSNQYVMKYFARSRPVPHNLDDLKVSRLLSIQTYNRCCHISPLVNLIMQDLFSCGRIKKTNLEYWPYRYMNQRQKN